MSVMQSKKKRISKKLKSSWRKHVKINDVEKFLEEQRLDERLGTLSSVPNHELFKLDTKPSLDLLPYKERRQLKASKPLKCFSILQPHSNVQDPITKRNRVRTKEERKNGLIKKKEIENQIKGILKAKEVQAEGDRKLYELQRKNRPKRGEFNKDIWENDKKFAIEQDQWATTNTKKHNLRGTGVPLKKITKSVTKKKSLIPAVEPPHPGMSYNPSYEDHQDLLKIVADKEMKLIKEDEHLTRCTKGMFQKVTVDKKDQMWLVEMSEGLPNKNKTNAEENEASDNEYKTVNAPVQNNKKTIKQRKKQKEQLKLEKSKTLIKREKKKISDIHQIKLLKNQIDNNEKKQKILREKRKKRLNMKKNNTKVLSAVKYVDPDLAFNMGHEITGSLKNLKTDGNLLVDRFTSMQKRNILAPSKKIIRKKAKVKKYTKPGHKDEDWKKTVARQI